MLKPIFHGMVTFTHLRRLLQVTSNLGKSGWLGGRLCGKAWLYCDMLTVYDSWEWR